MSKKPVLVILAAGLGSRYGGMKQIDGVDYFRTAGRGILRQIINSLNGVLVCDINSNVMIGKESLLSVRIPVVYLIRILDKIKVNVVGTRNCFGKHYAAGSNVVGIETHMKV